MVKIKNKQQRLRGKCFAALNIRQFIIAAFANI